LSNLDERPEIPSRPTGEPSFEFEFESVSRTSWNWRRVDLSSPGVVTGELKGEEPSSVVEARPPALGLKETVASHLSSR
jgi:hypothetical protein